MSTTTTRPVNLRIRAEDALRDATLIRVDADTWDRFLQALDQAPDGAGFERLMRAPRPWQP